MNHLQHLKNKIFTSDRVSELAALLRHQKGTQVFTNGCFDILHRGHIEYLSLAAGLGDYLVVGLNTDASVSRLKGPTRPLNDEMDRAMVLAALSFVSYVALFSEDNPYELIRQLAPDILVKGSDYSIDEIIGSDLVLARGGRVETLDFVPGYSTTAIEDRIRKQLK